MKESQYDPLFTKAVKQSGPNGISAPELHAKIGSSRQAAYQWVAKNKAHLRAVGQSPVGAQRYTWRDPNAAASADDVEIGSQFTVTRIRYRSGKVVAELVNDGGVKLEAPLN